MILSDRDISSWQEKGYLTITPFDERRLNPNSYNLSLSSKIVKYTDNILDIKKKLTTTATNIPETGLTLFPGHLYLGMTNERTHTPRCVPIIEGRSSLARLGISIHTTAGFGDVGFDGNWTLEISVIQPTIIYPNIEVAQIYFTTIMTEPLRLYSGKYQGSIEPLPSELFKEFQ